MAIALIIISIFLYYITAIDQLALEALSLPLIELQTTIKIPVWLIPLGLGFILLAPKGKKKDPNAEDSSARAMENPPSPQKTTVDAVENPVERAQISAEWKKNILDEIHALTLPAGAAIETDPFKGVPFGLRLERTTPQATRKALEEFALLISHIPTPPRVFIRLVDVIKTEVPPKNLVRGGFRKHLNVTALSITSQMDGIDIRFHQPDPLWENDPNLGIDV